MNEAFTSIYVLTVKPGKLDSFKDFVDKVVELSRNEPGTLKYEYSLSDNAEIATIEKMYRDSESFLNHINEVTGPYAGKFMQLADINSVYVFGAPNGRAKSTLEAFGATFMSQIDGFARS